jgi:hypothetical protein
MSKLVDFLKSNRVRVGVVAIAGVVTLVTGIEIPADKIDLISNAVIAIGLIAAALIGGDTVRPFNSGVKS